MNKYSLTQILVTLFVLVGTAQSNSVQSNQKIKTNAVLVIGTHSSAPEKDIIEMDKIGDLLTNRGVRVRKFYIQDANWEDIKRAAKNAHFFVYKGHGSNQGKNGTGGLVINDFISNDQIENELELKHNAMVLFQSVCGAAGSSASDRGDIGIKEAEQRVSDYAEPFINNGASVYYANNYHEGCLEFLNYFFSGHTIEQSYLKSLTSRINIEVTENYIYNPKYTVSITSSPPYGTVTKIHTKWINGEKVTIKEKVQDSKGYDTAFVGKSNFKFLNLKNLTL